MATAPLLTRHWCRKCRKTICGTCSAIPLSTFQRAHPDCMCHQCYRYPLGPPPPQPTSSQWRWPGPPARSSGSPKGQACHECRPASERGLPLVRMGPQRAKCCGGLGTAPRPPPPPYHFRPCHPRERFQVGKRGVDKSAPSCLVCGSKFSFIWRRHWCRQCLRTICRSCSAVHPQDPCPCYVEARRRMEKAISGGVRLPGSNAAALHWLGARLDEGS